MSLLPSVSAAGGGNDEAAWTIVFEDIALDLRVGAYASEKLAAQRVLISAELLVRPGAPLAADELDRVVDYDAIHRDIAALAKAPHVELQETLAERVAEICLAREAVAAVEVHVRKPDAYADTASVGIRIVRTRRTG